MEGLIAADIYLTQEVDLIVTALPAMRGPADESVLRQLLKAAENLDAWQRRRRLIREIRNSDEEVSGSLALHNAYTNEHQPKVLTQIHIRYQ